jgi:predicted NACHT family NTPase
MPELRYDWKRFWCPRSGQINPNLNDCGYLVDPESTWGHLYNPELVGFEAIARIPCLVLLGEPGIGKSREMKDLQAYTKNITDGVHEILYLDLRSYSDEARLIRDMFESRVFKDWLDGTHYLYIFLDSLDEGLLRIETLAALLVDEFCKKEYLDKVDRLYLRIACRTAVFPQILEEELNKIWQNNLKIYELAPLRRVDVIAAVTAHDLDPDAFLEEVEFKSLVSLAIKPITLKFLLNTFQRNHGQFPANQRLADLYINGCQALCEEQNSSRRTARRIGNFDPEQRLIIAARIAAISIFANRFAVWIEPNLGNVPDEDVLIGKLCLGSEKANERSFPVTEETIREVLDTGLFSSRGSSRMGWAHQTYAEFLAAWYLWKYKVPLDLVKQLIFVSEDTEHKLIPQLHETAAWLASMMSDILQEILKTDPDVLLRSDIPTDTSLRETIVQNLLIQYEQDKIYDFERSNYRNYRKLKHPGLAIQLRPYIQDSSKQFDARDIAINITETCEVTELQEELVDLALDSSQPIRLRVIATKALCSIGNKKTKLKLKTLAITQLPEDEDDSLKGYALRAVWLDRLITVEELFEVLTFPKHKNLLGAYRFFLENQLAPKLNLKDLVVALNWVTSKVGQSFDYSFTKIEDSIMLKALQYFQYPEIANCFTNSVLRKFKNNEDIISRHSSELEQKFKILLTNNVNIRHQLINKLILNLSNSHDFNSILWHVRENILKKEDVFWMIEEISKIKSLKIQKIWAKLIEYSFCFQDLAEIDSIILATQTNEILRETFASYFDAIDLNSAIAKEAKRNYFDLQEMQNKRDNTLLDPPPCEMILDLLDQLESGDLSAWWKLNRAMMLDAYGNYLSNNLDLDLTKLPGWQEATTITQTRIINGAKQYIQQQNDISYDWIGTNLYNLSDLSGCKALLLLLQNDPNFLDNLSPEVWKKWASIVVASIHYDRCDLELVNYFYINAPEEVIKTLIKMIDMENRQYDNVYILDKFDDFWDDRLECALLEKIKNKSLKPNCIGKILDYLFKHKSKKARKFVTSLLALPLPSTDDECERVCIAATVLVANSDPSSWLTLWSIVQQAPLFGRKIFELASADYRHRYIESQLELTEQQLADLYIWLVYQYPFEEDPDSRNQEIGYGTTTREKIANFRNNVLRQLTERGTPQACTEIQRIIQEFPTVTWFKKTLLRAQENMRRKVWKPPQPEKIIQIVAIQSIPDLELSTTIDEINERTKKMAEQPNIVNNISGGNFSGITNFTPNQGNQNYTTIETQNNYFETDDTLRQEIVELNQFIAELETKYPNVNTEAEAEKILDAEIVEVQTGNPTRWQTICRQWSLLKRQLFNPERHLQAAKATAVEVIKSACEKSLIAKAVITYLDKLSETPDLGA